MSLEIKGSTGKKGTERLVITGDTEEVPLHIPPKGPVDKMRLSVGEKAATGRNIVFKFRRITRAMLGDITIADREESRDADNYWVVRSAKAGRGEGLEVAIPVRGATTVLSAMLDQDGGMQFVMDPPPPESECFASVEFMVAEAIEDLLPELSVSVCSHNGKEIFIMSEWQS